MEARRKDEEEFKVAMGSFGGGEVEVARMSWSDELWKVMLCTSCATEEHEIHDQGSTWLSMASRRVFRAIRRSGLGFTLRTKCVILLRGRWDGRMEGASLGAVRRDACGGGRDASTDWGMK